MKKQVTIFDDYLKAPSIIRNKEALSTTYVPSQLPHRESEIRLLAQEMAQTFKGRVPSNLLIYGKTGTGKTAVVQYIGKELSRKINAMRADALGRSIISLTKDLRHRQGGGEAGGGSVEDCISERGGLGAFEERYQGSKASKIDFWLEQGNHGPEDDSELMRVVWRHAGDDGLMGRAHVGIPIVNVHYIYINCRHVDTEYRVLTNIANHFAERWRETVPFTGLHIDEVYRRLKQFLDRDGGITVIVLDEIDRLVYKNGDDVLYDLTRINYDLDRAKVSIIGISNDLNFTQFLESRVLSSLGAKETVFPPYNAPQLQDILRERAEMAFEPGVVGEGVIELCSALAAREHGDARRAIDLLRVSAEVAEQRKAEMINEHHVRMAMSQIEKDKIREVIRTLPMQSKVIMLAVVDLRSRGVKRVTTGDVYTRYKDLCAISGLIPLGPRRVTDILSELDMLGLLRARIVSFGRGGGRTKVVDLAMSIEQFQDSITEDETMEKYTHIIKKKR